MPLPLLIVAAILVVLSVPVQASQQGLEPATIASLSEEIVGENCYVARELVRDEVGQIEMHVEILCD